MQKIEVHCLDSTLYCNLGNIYLPVVRSSRGSASKRLGQERTSTAPFTNSVLRGKVEGITRRKFLDLQQS